MGKRKRGRRQITRRELVDRPATGLLQVGTPSPTARAVSLFQQDRLQREAIRLWDTQQFTVAVFARYPYRWRDEQGFGTLGVGRRKVKQAYGTGHIPGYIGPGRHFYGWRSAVVSRVYLERYRSRTVMDVVKEYKGMGPVRAVSIAPYEG